MTSVSLKNDYFGIPFVNDYQHLYESVQDGYPCCRPLFTSFKSDAKWRLL